MRIKVDILLGFLGSGKTTFIKSILQKREESSESIVVIQNESGKEDMNLGEKEGVFLVKRDMDESFDKKFFKNIITRFNPDRIIIEFNGMGDTENLLNFFSEPYMDNLFKIHRIIDVINMKTANMYLLNMGNKIREHIVNSDTIILTNSKNMSKENIKNIKRNIRSINEVAKIYEFSTLEQEEKSITKRRICLDSSNEKLSLGEVLVSITALLCFFLALLYLPTLSQKISSFTDTSYIDTFNTIFMGIIIETVPFILLGAFVSSIIQVCISENLISKLLSKNSFISCIIASLLGILFPVCDCGTIPVARGFLKKGFPLSVAVTFMLSAPIVNPISIMSTVYAFPANKEIVFYRVALGIVISVIIGLLMNRYNSKDVVTDYIFNCQCELCSGDYVYSKNVFTKIKGIILLSADEFINVGKYMIVGALASSIMQVLISKDMLNFIPNTKGASLLVMMFFAFVFSVCSTSDAFIARGFLNNFSKSSVIGFLVLGPMIDIKNTMMLLGSFKKSFVIKLIGAIMLVCFIVLMIIPV
ncbi:MAG: permease [Clostridium sp.]|nr:permease [Clostridium sp.]